MIPNSVDSGALVTVLNSRVESRCLAAPFLESEALAERLALVRAQNGCPAGQGPVPPGPDGTPRAARACP